MSKATNSTQFRTVDVDAYDEDNYQDETREDLSGSQEVGERGAQVKQLLSQTKNKEALKLSLQNPPIGHHDASVKEQNYEIVATVLRAFRVTDIDSAVEELEASELDVLMKYLYKGFTCSPDKAAGLLTWHEKVVKKGGIGSIVRVMVDRKGV